jgi:hypothetical protein
MVKEVVVASSIDDIDLLQIEFIAGNIAPLAGNGQDVFKDSRIENPGLIVDIVDGRLVVWTPSGVAQLTRHAEVGNGRAKHTDRLSGQHVTPNLGQIGDLDRIRRWQ